MGVPFDGEGEMEEGTFRRETDMILSGLEYGKGKYKNTIFLLLNLKSSEYK